MCKEEDPPYYSLVVLQAIRLLPIYLAVESLYLLPRS